MRRLFRPKGKELTVLLFGYVSLLLIRSTSCHNVCTKRCNQVSTFKNNVKSLSKVVFTF